MRCFISTKFERVCHFGNDFCQFPNWFSSQKDQLIWQTIPNLLAMAYSTEGMLKEGALKGKVIVITGGGTGLGRSMTQYFLSLGAKCVITSRKLDVIEQTAKELMAETGGEVLAVACDVRHYEQVEHLLQQSVARFGTVNVLLNNAAGNFISPTERLSHRAFDSVVDIVLKGSFYCAHAFGKYWIENKIEGNILSITTTYAWTGSAYVVPSACGKAGVLGMTRSLAQEWGHYGIRVNAIAPGPFPTKGAWERLMPPGLEKLTDPKVRIPLGRLGEHSELSNLAAFLVSDFSGYITGDCITIDGGEWMKSGGQFSWASEIPNEMWDTIEKQTRNASQPKP